MPSRRNQSNRNLLKSDCLELPRKLSIQTTKERPPSPFSNKQLFELHTSNMAASDIQNPPAPAESKSAKKKKAKAERTESPAPAASQAASITAADTQDDSSDNSYIRDLKK